MMHLRKKNIILCYYRMSIIWPVEVKTARRKPSRLSNGGNMCSAGILVDGLVSADDSPEVLESTVQQCNTH